VRLALALRDAKRQLTAVALNAVSPAHRTVGAEIVMQRFVERFAAAVEAADWTALLGWVDHACKRFAGILPIAALLAAVADAVGGFALERGSSLDAGQVELVRGEVERLAAMPRLVREPALHEAIDEIDVVLDDLITRVDQADPLTAEHSRAVASWCRRLGRRLSLDKHDIVHVTRCGLIHDIGKITTPPEILNAPRKLDDEEMTIMRRHAEEGAKIIAVTPLAANLTPAVRNHHERFDGRGYPDGLAGGAIPSTARIVAVADAFNAMIGRRPYRPPFAPSLALERLVESRGTQFDPIVVDAMVDVVTSRD
jgi:putative nucleotidyltransferase with HDIG domain